MGITCEKFPSAQNPDAYDELSFKYKIKGNPGYEACILTYGARIQRLIVPGDNNKSADIVLGLKDLDAYLADGANHGAVVGRSANRIAGASFTIDGNKYTIPQNDGNNNLHTGNPAFQNKFWDAEVLNPKEADSFIKESGLAGLCDDESRKAADDFLLLSCKSDDMECGFPGNLITKVLYGFLKDDTFLILYSGLSDKKTVFAPTNHAYFNLRGHGKGTVRDEILKVLSDEVTIKDKNNCPDGSFMPVEGTPFDFRFGAPVSLALDMNHPQIGPCLGLDQNFCLKNQGRYELAARLDDPLAPHSMEVWTDMPGIQFYAGNHLGGDDNKDGASYRPYDALCLEAQMYPNAVNIPEFESPLIEAGQIKYHACGYRFI